VRLNADSLAERCLGTRLLPSRQPDDAQIAVRFGHVRIERNGSLEGGDRIRGLALRPIGQPQFMPGGGVIRGQGDGPVQYVSGLRILSSASESRSQFEQAE